MRVGKFHVLQGLEIGRTIISALNPVADILRDLKTEPFGARPYQVHQVWTRWSGGTRGEGVEEVIAERLILPTPKVADLKGLSATQQMIGQLENGALEVSEISPRYTEEELRGLETGFEEIPGDQSFYWEIMFPRADGAPVPRRAFSTNSAPSYDATNFQWTIRLVRARRDREFDGTPNDSVVPE